jgi:hypothetical protein
MSRANDRQRDAAGHQLDRRAQRLAEGDDEGGGPGPAGPVLRAQQRVGAADFRGGRQTATPTWSEAPWARRKPESTPRNRPRAPMAGPEANRRRRSRKQHLDVNKRRTVTVPERILPRTGSGGGRQRESAEGGERRVRRAGATSRGISREE